MKSRLEAVGQIGDSGGLSRDLLVEAGFQGPVATAGSAGTGTVATSVIVLQRPADLLAYEADLESLAAEAIEPNVFYEPWMLAPALTCFGQAKRFQFVLVFGARIDDKPGASSLIGFFPLEQKARFNQLPVGVLELWKHIHCYLCTPLIRTGFADLAVEAFLDWCDRSGSPGRISEFGTVPGEGPFQEILQSCLESRGAHYCTSDEFSRTIFKASLEEDGPAVAAFRGKKRRDLKRKQKRLSELGRLEYCPLAAKDDLEIWVEEFLRLEAKGWKGRQKTALACHDADRRFFFMACSNAFLKGRLMAVALRLNGAPIAMQFNFLSGQCCFAFKTTFDENYAHFSPGLLLGLNVMERVVNSPEPLWIDFCAAPDSPMPGRLSTQRRRLQTITITRRQTAGSLILSTIQVLKQMKGRFRAAPTARPGEDARAEVLA
jgi:hypothetical protein